MYLVYCEYLLSCAATALTLLLLQRRNYSTILLFKSKKIESNNNNNKFLFARTILSIRNYKEEIRNRLYNNNKIISKKIISSVLLTFRVLSNSSRTSRNRRTIYKISYVSLLLLTFVVIVCRNK